MTFEQKIHAVVKKIPKGQVLTYKEVAKKIGHPLAFRAVGNVLGKNIDPKCLVIGLFVQMERSADIETAQLLKLKDWLRKDI